MKNEEWEILREKYDKESNRRWKLEARKKSAKGLQEVLKGIVNEKGRIEEIQIYIPGVDWWNHEHKVCLKNDRYLINLFIECLENFIPYLNKCIDIDIENDVVEE